MDEAVAHDRAFGLNSFIASAQVGYLVAAELQDSLGNVVFPRASPCTVGYWPAGIGA